MKTLRYFLAIAVIILGFLVGWTYGWFLFEGLIGFWRENYVSPIDSDFGGDFETTFFRFLSGVIGLLFFLIAAIYLWPGKVDKGNQRKLLIIDLVLLITLLLGIIGGFFLYWRDWESGDRDYLIHLVPYCGLCFTGIPGLALIFVIFLIHKAEKDKRTLQNNSSSNNR